MVLHHYYDTVLHSMKVLVRLCINTTALLAILLKYENALFIRATRILKQNFFYQHL